MERSSQSLIPKFLAASLVVYVLMGLFAGLPPAANLGAFVFGLVLLFAAILVLMASSWHALMRPLPDKLMPSKKLPLSHEKRQGIALFLTMMSAVGIAGGLWDVTWHVHSGLPFGEDFFWAPHQFIYVSMLAPIVVAGILWVQMMRNGSGTLRQRLRADVPVTLLFIGGVSMLFTLPADPLWHVVYGEDLTGLSVPHIVFSVSSTISFVGIASILLSYTPVRKVWESVLKISLMELVIVFSLGLTYTSLLLPTLGDWEAISLSSHALPRLPAMVAARPDWSMTFLAAFVPVFVVSTGLAITRRYGTATLIWVIAALIRSGLYLSFGYGDTGMSTMLLTLPFVLALDVAAWYRGSRGKSLNALPAAVVTAVVGTAAVLPLIPVFYIDPVVSASNVPLMVISMFAAGLVASFMGSTLGEAVYNTKRFEQPAGQPAVSRNAIRVVSALTVLAVVITVVFVVNSTMPSA